MIRLVEKGKRGAPVRPAPSRERLRTGVSLLLSLPLLISPLTARDLRVGIDPDVPSIAHAVKLAAPGDTIHLEAGKVYRDYAGFHGKRGEPGRPIVLDGHGAILDGSDPLEPAAWSEGEAGLYAHANLFPNLNAAVLSRWFFLWNGKVNRMGRASKAKSKPFKAPADLLPGEWTFVRDPSRERADSKRIFGTFYLRLAPGRTLADETLFVPLRSAGVQLSGENAHLVIRNLTARHPYNDGFNIHGHCEDVVFENIAALGCGDDGISAHGTAQYRVRGLVSVGNSTGICDTVDAVTDYEDVFVADCVSYDLFFLDRGRYSLTNALVLSSAQNPFAATGREEGGCRLRLENVLFRRLVEPRLGLVGASANLEATRCTFEGMEFRTVGTATWTDSLVNGVASEAGARGADAAALDKLVPEAHRP